jgi:predicted amidohydrolase YtcJ
LPHRFPQNIPELLAVLKKHAATLPEGAWVEGQGYRVQLMAEKRHPTKEELETVSSTRPVFVADSSGHHAVRWQLPCPLDCLGPLSCALLSSAGE